MKAQLILKILRRFHFQIKAYLNKQRRSNSCVSKFKPFWCRLWILSEISVWSSWSSYLISFTLPACVSCRCVLFVLISSLCLQHFRRFSLWCFLMVTKSQCFSLKWKAADDTPPSSHVLPYPAFSLIAGLCFFLNWNSLHSIACTGSAAKNSSPCPTVAWLCALSSHGCNQLLNLGWANSAFLMENLLDWRAMHFQKMKACCLCRPVLSRIPHFWLLSHW